MANNNASLQNVSRPNEPPVHVLINPESFGVNYATNYAALNAPGMQMPLLQFVRGETRLLNMQLLLDSFDARGEANAYTATDPDQPVDQPVQGQGPPQDPERGKTVRDRLLSIRKFVLIDPELHAPPVCRFQWGDLSFDGVMTTLNESYTLFADDGTILRARLTIVMKSYKSVEDQITSMNLRSPDRTRVRTIREGETLAQLAQEAYGDSRQWRAIADANGIDRPRFIAPGTTLRIPAL